MTTVFYVKKYRRTEPKTASGPNYTIYKKHFSATFFDAFFMVLQGA